MPSCGIGPKAEENKAAFRNAIALFGRYKVEGNTFTYEVEASSFPNWYDVTQSRQFSISGNELRFTNPADSTDITAVGVLKRVK